MPNTPLARVVLIAGCIGLDCLVWRGAVQLSGPGSLPSWLPVLAMALGHLSLWLLPTRLTLVVVVEVVLGCASLVVAQWQPFAALLALGYAAPAHLGWRRSAPILAAILAVFASHSWGSARATADPLASTLTLMALWSALTVVIALAGARAHGRTEIARRTADLLTQLTQAHEAGRRELARDLHDGVAGAITAIHLYAASARAQVHTHADAQADTVPASLEVIESSAERSLAELRRVMRALRDPGAEVGGPNVRQVPLLLQAAEAAGLVIRSTGDWDGAADVLDPPAAAALVRTVQESLTNAIKHAGLGAACTLTLVIEERADRPGIPDGTQLTVRTDPPRAGISRGCRPTGWSGGDGLRGLAERAEAAGGRLTVHPGASFTLALHLPSGALAGSRA